MEKDHMCKFCSKRFPCGRSLGGHMRSHLINISPSDHPKTAKKKLPPLLLMDGGDQFDHPRKSSKASEVDTLLQEKACKECGKTFQSWKALFGHMKCHSVNDKLMIMDSQSDNEAATPFCRRKKRSDRMKRYTANYTNSSLSNFSSEVFDQQDQEEEVALSLIFLSRDKGDWGGLNSAFESSDNSSELLEAKKTARISLFDSKMIPDHKATKFKKLRNVKQLELKSAFVLENDETESKKKNSRKRHDSDQDSEAKTSKFACSICMKAFPSYQALGGHRASHKKFKSCCFPRSENSVETENSEKAEGGCIKLPNKEHECPICFKVFSSGQALGGHKRSHVINDQAKNNRAVENEQPVREIRGFLDLNMPAPDEEECSEFKPWWIATSQKQQQLLGLLS